MAATAWIKNAGKESDIRSGSKVAGNTGPISARAGAGASCVAGIARPERGSERRAEVESLTRDHVTVGPFDQTSLNTGLIHLGAAVRSGAREGEEFCRVATGRRLGCELGSRVPTARSCAGRVVVQPLIAEEDEEFILEDRASGRTAPVVESVGIFDVPAVIAIVFCKSVEARA